MSEDDRSEVRGGNQENPPVGYVRRSTVGSLIPTGLVLGLATLSLTVFGFVLAAYRDAQNQLQSNFTSYAAANQAQHTQIWDEVSALQLFLCAKFPSWRKCK